MTKEEVIKKLNAIKEYLTEGNPIWDVREISEVLDMALYAVKAKMSDKGEWIRWVVEIEDDTGVLCVPHAKCSNCGTEQDPYTTLFINYCPNCGCAMTKQHTKD